MAIMRMGPLGPVDIAEGDRVIPVPAPIEVCERYREIVAEAARHRISEFEAAERMRREVLPYVTIPVHDYRPDRDILRLEPAARAQVGGRGG